MSTRSIAPEPGRLRREEEQPPAQTDKPSRDKPSPETNRDRKPDEPIGEAFPDRDPTKKKTGEF
jgi:hypothetical protein